MSDVFITNAKLWPAGTELDFGIDTNPVVGNYQPTRQAAKFASDGGANTYQFLFWNTGRHLTSKRNVRWNFTVFGWGVWTATRWYGIPGPGGPGSKKIRATAFSIGGNQTLGSATPIAAPPASTFPANAWPDGGDDHVVSTANGAVSIAAKDPYDSYDFAGWMQLIWGGDDSSEFVETDAGAAPGQPGFYEHVTGGAANFLGAQNSSADLLATYGYHPPPDRGRFIPDRLRDWIYELIIDDMIKPGPEIVGDSSPIDRIRTKLLEALVTQTRPGSRGATDFQSLIEAAPNMNPAELKRAVQQLKTTLDLGHTALGALEARLKGK